MSDREPVHLGLASSVAEHLVADIAAATTDIIIVGSVRRKVPEVHDIEVVAFPLGGGPQPDLFGDLRAMPGNPVLERLKRAPEWKVTTGGDKIIRAEHGRTGLVAEIYLVGDLRAWGPTVIVRTGPRGFSVSMMTRARKQAKVFSDGFLLHAHPAQSADKPCAQGPHCQFILDLRQEVDVFTALGMSWIPPEERR